MINTPRRLLAVDDDVSSAELIVRIAERCGFEAFATSDSRGVMNLTNALRPDVMAVDVHMPNIDANALFQLLAQARYAGRILIISGQEQDVLNEVRANAIKAGLNAPIVHRKPIEIPVLRSIFTSEDFLKAA
jgi:two-component system, chemotaxis family, chemotaxis protein CheY